MNIYLIVIFLSYIAAAGTGYWIEYLNLNNLKRYGSVIPPEFEVYIDQDLLTKTRDYTIEKTIFGIVSSVFSDIILLIFIFGGVLNIYNSWIVSINLNFIISGLAFLFVLSFAETILSTPFEIYSLFRIENKYGFNTMTPGLWIRDKIKSLLISIILMGIVVSAGLYLTQYSQGLWWLWLWCFFLVFSLFMMYISPYVIEPLFNKFTPVDNESLLGSIRGILQKAGITAGTVFKMDASRRTRHTNAYFTGIGKVKRIVLFDTLIENMEIDELMSVLAHEAGHWKRRHLLKNIIFTEGIALIVIFISFKILQSDILLNIFNIKEGTFFAKIVILGMIGSIVSFPFSPVLMYISRRYENEADRFSYELTGNNRSMISALIKLSKDNLSNLHPHPLYVIFHYSHPPVLERIKNLTDVRPPQASSVL
ncbi:MAG: M48 family metallopeptidase [Nitrospira sp.]|nr:M48 family metallopeptidase [Nitrospira sp.]